MEPTEMIVISLKDYTKLMKNQIRVNQALAVMGEEEFMNVTLIKKILTVDGGDA